MKTLIKNGNVLFVDKNSDFVEVTDVVINGSKISYIGNVEDEKEYDKIIDATNKLVMPGFINMHTHIPMSYYRSYSDDMLLFDWLESIWKTEDLLNSEEIYYGTMLGISELIKSGTTCFNDMYTFGSTIAKAAENAKFRAVIGHTLMDKERAAQGENFGVSRELFKKYHESSNDRIRTIIGAHAIYTISEEYLKEIIDFAKEMETKIHIHISESKEELENCIKQHGKSPVEYLNDLGFFELDVLAAHCVHLSDNDIKILREKGIHVLYNPISNLKLANGFARIVDMKNEGINISLGTDSCGSNNNLSMFEEIKTAAIVNKGLTNNPTSLPAIEVIRMATINGAKALGIDDKVGSIKVGKNADITIIDLNKTHLRPTHNIVSLIVYAMQSSDVDTVLVDGNILMENRKLLTINENEVLRNIDKCINRLMKN